VTGFIERIATMPPVHDAGRADQALEDLERLIAGNGELEQLGAMLAADNDARALLRSVFGASPFLTRTVLRDPEGLQIVLRSDPRDVIQELGIKAKNEMTEGPSMDQAMALLRSYKRRVALTVALADVAGVWSTMEAAAVLSGAADLVIELSVAYLIVRAKEAGDIAITDMDDPAADSGYFVLAMGKLGANELNYSSDVDLMVFYDPSRASLGKDVEAGPLFVRLTRDLIRMLQERTSDDYVFRTDLRLRPDPGATQIAISTEAGLTYYESFGQNWERAALIKARIVAGDHEAGEHFLEQLAPFVWRKYLDYAAIADIHAMKRRVHAFKGHGEVAVAGHDVKLGRGGIREIEFFVQSQQLIAGGRQTDLRTRQTLETLKRLAQHDWISDKAVGQLTEAYCFLRKVEHRIQMIADEQTHHLPKDEEGLSRVAHFSGFAGVQEFGDALVATFSTVQEHYDALFEDLPEPPQQVSTLSFQGDEDDPQTLSVLEGLGYANPQAVSASVRGWRFGRYAATHSEAAREQLDAFLPHLLEALAATAQPDVAFSAFDRFLADLPAGIQLFSLLRSNPSLLRLIADIMGSAPRLSSVLSRRARVLDAVLDPGFFGDLPTQEELESLVRDGLDEAGDYQGKLDRARVLGREQAFLIGVRVLSGTITADDAGGAYARLAETLVQALKDAVEAELESAHGRIKGGAAAVVALGKLGGREITAASDLDLIVIYDFDEDASTSDGAKPLAASQYYARLTQRLISALAAPTAEGTLYEVDMRLRPSGNAGPVATSLKSFTDYQQKEAWTWEHLALTRARVIAGPEPLRRAIEGAIGDVIARPRDKAKIAADVREMRAKIEKEKGTQDPWALKQVRGGLVDLEFITQFLQVTSASAHPQVIEQNTAACLDRLSEVGVLAAGEAEILLPAAKLYNNLTQVLRLSLEGSFTPDEAPEGLKDLLDRAAGLPDFSTLERHLKETQMAVRELFDQLIA
jgi:glutamate-ammonia-ligase adenylyltransferase